MFDGTNNSDVFFFAAVCVSMCVPVYACVCFVSVSLVLLIQEQPMEPLMADVAACGAGVGLEHLPQNRFSHCC